MKTCCRCQVTKDISEFDEDKRVPGRLRAQCRKCNDYRDTYYLAHRAESIARAKKTLAAKGRDAVNKYKRDRHKIHPESLLLQNARARAKKAGIPFDLDYEDVAVPAVCPILGIPLIVGAGGCTPNSPSLDRIDPRHGYVRGNVVVLSHRANTIKNDATPEELRRVADFVENHLKNS